MNQADKQEEATAKALGPLAYERVFIYQTDTENYTQIYIEDESLSSGEVANLFDKNFLVKKSNCDNRSLFITNLKISKEGNLAV